MDTDRFDALSRLLATGSRRRFLGFLPGVGLSAVASLLGIAEADGHNARLTCKKIKEKQRRQRCLKKAKKHNRRHATEPSAPPLPPATPLSPCADAVRNGSETDVDCGGFTCPRCANGKSCAGRNDCASALCVGGTCQPCGGGDCGTDMHGGCTCDGGTCIKRSGFGVSSCEACPANTVCRGVKGGLACFSICGTA